MVRMRARMKRQSVLGSPKEERTHHLPQLSMAQVSASQESAIKHIAGVLTLPEGALLSDPGFIALVSSKLQEEEEEAVQQENKGEAAGGKREESRASMVEGGIADVSTVQLGGVGELRPVHVFHQLRTTVQCAVCAADSCARADPLWRARLHLAFQTNHSYHSSEGGECIHYSHKTHTLLSIQFCLSACSLPSLPYPAATCYSYTGDKPFLSVLASYLGYIVLVMRLCCVLLLLCGRYVSVYP